VRGGEAAELSHVAAKLDDVALGDLGGRHSLGSSALDDTIVDVGDVAHERHVEAACAKPAVEDVEGDEYARMPDVTAIVDGDAADVDTGLARGEWRERLDTPGQSVVERERYLSSPE
jgi:hypothetical protein